MRLLFGFAISILNANKISIYCSDKLDILIGFPFFSRGAAESRAEGLIFLGVSQTLVIEVYTNSSQYKNVNAVFGFYFLYAKINKIRR